MNKKTTERLKKLGSSLLMAGLLLSISLIMFGYGKVHGTIEACEGLDLIPTNGDSFFKFKCLEPPSYSNYETNVSADPFNTFPGG